tara:strand:- start:1062 stop:1337 length:276 start_codon:yes stop_codon:yes gene_type:complete
MPIKVNIPTPLRKLTNGDSEVSIDATQVGELIENLDSEFNGIAGKLLDEKGEIRRYVNVFVNDEDIRFLDGKTTSLKDGDEVSIVPAIAGG